MQTRPSVKSSFILDFFQRLPYDADKDSAVDKRHECGDRAYLYRNREKVRDKVQ
jgi:hypothetical protein